MKAYALLTILLTPIACGQQISSTQQLVGGNISPLRPGFTQFDLAKAEQGCTYLRPGSIARFQTIWWETYWSPSPQAGNYRGIDASIDLAAKYRLTPLFLLQPAPHPTSQWQPGNDWWLPPVSLHPKIFECTSAMIAHINDRCKSLKLTPMFQIWNEPAGKSINPPLGEKPGGSKSTKFGEWSAGLTPLFKGIMQCLKDNGVPPSRRVYPAISCIGESRESAEWASCWTGVEKDCGVLAVHFRWRAGWATDPATRIREVTNGFTNNAEYLAFQIASHKEFKGKRILMTEMYVTPADSGAKLSDNIDFARKIALDLCTKNKWTPIVWGLDDNGSVPGDPWNTFSGWGPLLSSLKNASVVK